MQVTVVPLEELKRMRDKVRPVVDRFAANPDAKLAQEMFAQVEASGNPNVQSRAET